MRRQSKASRIRQSMFFAAGGRKETRTSLSSQVGSGGRTCDGKLGKVVGYSSIGLLSIVALTLLCPSVSSSHAEEVSTERMNEILTAGSVNEFTSSVHTDIKSYVRSTIALSITGQVNLDLTPKANGTFSTEKAELSISTNNVSGYSVYLAMNDSSSNSLLPMNTRSTEEIVATPETMTAENYRDYLNTWGYKVAGDTGYKAVPTTSSTPIITESSSSQQAEYELSFAVAVGADLPAGVYGNQVLVSTVANPIEVRGINDITYMQEMTSDICLVSFENETKQLIDTRDGKSYWVAKLKDGNCWMTQNLALDIALDSEGNAAALSESGTKVTLDESNSDMKGRWGQDSTIKPQPTSVEFPIRSEQSGEDAKSWNLADGNVLKYPLNKDVSSGCYAAGEETWINCKARLRVNVSDEGWQPTLKAAIVDGKFVAVNEVEKVYDEHYMLGNYYQTTTATAGSKVENSMYSESVCPKGWILPMVTAYSTRPGMINLISRYYNSEITQEMARNFLPMTELHFVFGGILYTDINDNPHGTFVARGLNFEAFYVSGQKNEEGRDVMLYAYNGYVMDPDDFNRAATVRCVAK